MKTLRKIMGRGSYTMSGRGMTSYCMSDGKTPCTPEDYQAVATNLMKELGEPAHTDGRQARYWYKDGLGVIILPKYNGAPYQYVELDKSGTREYFEQFVKKDKKKLT